MKSEPEKFTGFKIRSQLRKLKVPKDGPIFYHPDFCSCSKCIEKRKKKEKKGNKK